MAKDNEPNAGGAGAPAAHTPENSAEADRLLAEVVAKRKPLTGIQNAVETLRRIDEDAHVLWTTTGPRRTHTEEIAGVLVKFPESGRLIVIALGYSSGAFKLFMEVAGKTSDEQLAALNFDPSKS